MISRSPRSAHSTNSARRRALRTTPVGNWWQGVTTTASAEEALSASTSMPSASNGIGVTARPATSTISRWACQPGAEVVGALWHQRGRGRAGRVRGHARSNSHGSALPGLYVPLGRQLLADRGHDPARDAELVGQGAARGQPGARLEVAVADRVA